VKVVLEGSLSKRGNNLLKDWRERWVEVVEVVHGPHNLEARAGQVRTPTTLCLSLQWLAG
jgi:hypothetical protein